MDRWVPEQGADRIHRRRVRQGLRSRKGARFLADRVWPRGISKERECIVAWRKDVAPTPLLCTWFRDDPAKWNEFRQRDQSGLTHSGQLKSAKDRIRDSRRKIPPVALLLCRSMQTTFFMMQPRSVGVGWWSISG
jgi:uncharacterized protein YeaO (DUF488 family)